ncbi:MAG: Coenzyme F420 hydrogenase/dehydrogenase, beta subunit C-terminal domain [Dehalococcoidia bacterium]|nr:Coenzyme F420 hydrogenase/dehydrogenase, beta subunit C-terminal domain [Dehalococcoidia bacterium]
MKVKGCKELFEEVINRGLCTLCGACIGRCPYMAFHKGKQVLLRACNLSDGECYLYCPRTYMDMDALSQKIFGAPYGEDEFGTAKEILLARATNPDIKSKGQDGGTVSTLLSLAIEEGLIEGVMSSRMLANKTPRGFIARNRDELLECAGSCYTASPVLEAYNRIPEENNEKLGVVGLPCQIQAFTKMRLYPPKHAANVNNVKLAIGIFCGWALMHAEFHKFLKEHYDLSHIVKFDIPHHPEHTFDMYTKSEKKSIELDDIKKFIMPTCSYCTDMTAEFSDISVGSGRRQFLGWNTVIVRTNAGEKLVKLAKAKGMLETQPLPPENLTHLKIAALNKKKAALNAIIAVTGNQDNLLYLWLPEGMANALLTKNI